ncbi:O-methyltransferase [Streptacidiphilus anmyonensis]|uniref:O-methyltransferase n=1 Tax=Streptacidiphilus anmyonensis TaxID=405782 RepID=UPI003F6EDE9F
MGTQLGAAREEGISGYGQADPALADAYAVEDPVLEHARELSLLSSVRPVSPGSGAALRLLAAATGARAVVEIGTGAGVSGICLLRGMRADGILTTVDVQPGLQRQAREVYAAAGFAPSRARLIPGPALEVLPRLADGQYDLVFCDGDPAEATGYLAESLRLLRSGGTVCFEGALSGVRTPAVRELMRQVREHPDLIPALLPVGDGLLAAVRR